MCVGELANFIIGVSLVLPPAIMYKINKSKKISFNRYVTWISISRNCRNISKCIYI